MKEKDKKKEKEKEKEKGKKDKKKNILSFFSKKKSREEEVRERELKVNQKYKAIISHFIIPKRTFPTPNINLQDYSNDTKKIVIAQSIVRRFLVTNSIQGLTRTQLLNQRNAILSLVKLQNRYLANFEVIIKEYLIPLRNSKFKGTKFQSYKKVLETLFSNIEELHEFEKIISDKLFNFAQLWPVGQEIGRFILEILHQFKIYEKYVIGIAEYSQELRDLEYEKSQVVPFIKNIDAQRKVTAESKKLFYRDLKTLLRLPTKHLFRYKHPLKKLVMNTLPTNRDYNYRIYVAASIREVSLYVAYRYENSLARREMFKLQERIISMKGFTIDIPTRKLVRQGEMLVNNKPVRKVFLFNDICMVTKIQNSVTFCYEDHIDLKGAKLRRLYTDGLKQVFSLISDKNENFTFSPKNNSKSKSWQKSFEDVLSKRNDQVFGVKIEELLERDRTPIPKMLFAIAYRLNRALYQNKVFRSAGDPYIISSLKRRFNLYIHEINLSESSATDVAALLIPYLESLPEPVFPIDVTDKFFHLTDSEYCPDLVYSFYIKGIEKMAVGNRNLFEFIVFLLHSAVRKRKEFMLTSVEMAVLFSPLLFQSTRKSYSTCIIMPRIVKSFEELLNNPSAVFTIPNNLKVPSNVNDFINSDLFGDWWRAFRISNKQILSFLTHQSNILEILSLIRIKNFTKDRSEKEYLQQLQSASYATLILTNDDIIPHLVQDQTFVHTLLHFLDDETTSEVTLSYFRDILECLFEFDSENMTKNFISTPALSTLLLHRINYGNVLSFLVSLCKLSILYQNTKYHAILDVWSTETIRIFNSKNVGDYSEETLDNLSIFLCALFEDYLFFQSKLVNEFVSTISDPSTINHMIDNIFALPYEKSKSIINVFVSLLTKKKITQNSENEQPDQQNDNNNNESEQDESIIDQSDIDDQKEELEIQISEVEVLPNVTKLILEIILKRINSFEGFLNEAVKQRQPLGCQRILIIQLIDSLLTSSREEVLELLISSNIMSTLINLFFLYPNNNILHSYVSHIIGSILSSYSRNKQVIQLLFDDTSLIEKISSSLQLDKNTAYHGHLLKIGCLVVADENLMQMLKSKVGFEFMKTKVVEYQNATNLLEVVPRKHRYYTIDRYEDRI